MSHTPGPWHIERNTLWLGPKWNVAVEGISLAEVWTDADARLIAAAPTMAAQLRAIRAEARAELARIERDGGTAGFAKRILAIVGEIDG